MLVVGCRKQCDGLEEVGVLDEVGGLTVEGLRWSEMYKMSEKGWNKKMVWGSKHFKKGGYVG